MSRRGLCHSRVYFKVERLGTGAAQITWKSNKLWLLDDNFNLPRSIRLELLFYIDYSVGGGGGYFVVNNFRGH